MNLMVLDSAALIILIFTAVMPTATLSLGCSTYFQDVKYTHGRHCGDPPHEYRGYDDVPELMVSAMSCELTSGQLSIELTNIDLANYDDYADVIVEMFCVNSSSNVSSCRNCLSDEEPQLSFGQCNECVINQSLYAFFLGQASNGWLFEPINHSFKVLGDPISSVQCYLRGCGAPSPCVLYKFKALPIICQNITTTTTPDYSIISSLFSVTLSANDITTSTTTTTPESVQASTLLTSVTSVIHYNSSEGQYTVDDSIVLSQSLPYSTVIINTTLMSPTTFPIRVSSTTNSHSNSKSSTSLSSQLSLVIAAISLVCLIAIIVLIGFLLIYKSWTNKNKTVEDKHTENKIEEIHKVGFEPSKLDIASLSSVRTIVQELYQPSLTAIINNEECFGFKEGIGQMNQPKPNPTVNPRTNQRSPDKPLTIVRTLSSSPYAHNKTMIERNLCLSSIELETDNEQSSRTEDMCNDSIPRHILAINTRPHAIDEHTMHTQLNIEHSKLDISAGDGSSVWDGSQEEADKRDRDDSSQDFHLTSLNILERSLSFDEYINCNY